MDRRWEAENYGNGYDNRDYEPGYHEPPGTSVVYATVLTVYMILLADR